MALDFFWTDTNNAFSLTAAASSRPGRRVVLWMRVRAYVRIRSAGATALFPLLLLTSLLDAAGHQLLCRDAPALSGIAADLPSAGPQIAPSEAERDHDCPCYGLGGSRITLGPPSTTDPAVVVTEVATARRGALFVEPFPASHPSRGPPLC